MYHLVVQAKKVYFASILMVFSFAQTMSDSALAADTDNVWTGSYTCSGTKRDATLTFISDSIAEFAVSPGEGAKLFPAGKFESEVWRRGDELLVIGHEWIQKSNGFSLITLRLKESEDTLEGKIEHRGCGEIKFVRPGSEIDAKPSLSLPDEDNFPLYFTTTHQCPRETISGYWKLKEPSTDGLVVEFTRRSQNNPRNAVMRNFTLKPRDGVYKGLESSGQFGLALQFPNDKKIPVAQWLDRNGNLQTHRNSCENPVLTSAAAPIETWESFFELASTPDADINTVSAAVSSYQSLPHSNYLDAMDQQRFINQLPGAWQELQNNFSKNMPSNIKAMEVDTSEHRQTARRDIIAMAKPGFRHRLNFGKLYADRLLDAGVTPEPLYFTDEPVACERIKQARNFQNSMAKVALFAGLPAENFDEQVVSSILDKIKTCEAQDPTLKQAASIAMSTITRQIPNLNQANQKIAWLKEQAQRLEDMPASLDTLLKTNNYTLSKKDLNTQKIKKDIFQTYFESRMLPLRTIGLANAKKELAAEFDYQTDDFPELQSLYRQCEIKAGKPKVRASDWQVELLNVCAIGAAKGFKVHLNNLQSGIDATKFDEQQSLEFLATGIPRQYDVFSSKVKTSIDIARYRAHVINTKQTIGANFQTKLQTLFDANSENDDLHIAIICGKQAAYKYIGKTCTALSQQMKKRAEIKRCDERVIASGVSNSLKNDHIILGNSVTSRDISIRDYICLADRNGIDIHIDRKGNLQAKEKTHGKMILTAKIESVRESAGIHYRELADVELHVGDSLLKDKSPNELADCLLSQYNCY